MVASRSQSPRPCRPRAYGSSCGLRGCDGPERPGQVHRSVEAGKEPRREHRGHVRHISGQQQPGRRGQQQEWPHSASGNGSFAGACPCTARGRWRRIHGPTRHRGSSSRRLARTGPGGPRALRASLPDPPTRPAFQKHLCRDRHSSACGQNDLQQNARPADLPTAARWVAAAPASSDAFPAPSSTGGDSRSGRPSEPRWECCRDCRAPWAPSPHWGTSASRQEALRQVSRSTSCRSPPRRSP
jgi:hypothetical protein